MSDVAPAAFKQDAAASYIDVERSWLDDAPIPRVDMRKPGASKPTWRWRRVDLDAWLESRLVPPGKASPFV